MEMLLKEEVYTIVGYCIEVWKTLGYGFSEVIYKDAMEHEFIYNEVPHIREEELAVNYKGNILRHKFKADFTLFGNIIVEVKSGEDSINDQTISQTLNYLKASGCRIG
jgi:GxxExxY protein